MRTKPLSPEGRGSSERSESGVRGRAWHRRPRLCVVATVALAAACAAEDVPAFRYDPAKTAVYLHETIAAKADGPAAELRKELAAAVDEVLDGPWAPLYSDYSAAQAGGVGPAEWVFARPGDQFLALAQAAPCMSPAQKEKAKKLLQELLKSASPTRKVYTDPKGKPRGVRKTPPVQLPWLSGEDTQRLLFAEGYAVWAWAKAFEAWDEAKPCYEDLKALRGQLEKRGDLAPAYKAGEDATLTATLTEDPEYRFRVYESLFSGCQDNYQYWGARQCQNRMEKGKPVFFYVKVLSALLGYHRLAEHYGEQAEMKWAEENFNRVAALTLAHKPAPYLWSDPYLVPEAARLLRDHAGKWIVELKQSPNSADLPAYEGEEGGGHKPLPGKKNKRVTNPFTWYQAWGGQGEGVRPRTVLGAFLANAWLFQAPAERIAETRDIPWCPADLYYVRKLVTAIQATEKVGWTKVP